MPTNTNTSSPFATKDTPAEEIKALCAAVDVLATSAGDELKWTDLHQACPNIGYSRGWLIARRYQLEKFAPETCERLTQTKDQDERYAQAKKFHHARMNLQLSWGEIAVRFGVPESYVRACFKLYGVENDKGLRIGKGGRWVADRPDLYLDNRKKEGAHLPHDVKGISSYPVEKLLNFKPREGSTTTQAKAQAMGRIIKLMAKANDKAVTEPERDSLNAKVAELMEKYNITVADLSAFKARKAGKGKAA